MNCLRIASIFFNINSIRIEIIIQKCRAQQGESCFPQRRGCKTRWISRGKTTQYRGTTKSLAFSGKEGGGLHLEVAALPRHRSYGCSKISRSAAAMPAHIRGCRPRKTPATTFILQLRIHGDVARVCSRTLFDDTARAF